MQQVLTIDDSSVIRAYLRALFEGAGFQVLEAEDGQDGLSKLRALAQPAIVVLDYQMPVMTGAEVLEEVARAGAPLTRHEYLILSSYAGTFPDALIDLVRTLSIRVLAKGVPDDDLVSAVRQAEERLQAPPDDDIPVPSADEPRG